MNWNEVGSLIGKAAPLVGSLLGPAGTLVGGLVATALNCEATPEAVSQAIKNDPEAFVKLKELELQHKERLEGMAFKYAETAITQVNTTMRAEAKSEGKLQRNWRPLWGIISAVAFLEAVTFVGILGYKAVIGGDMNALNMIPQLVGAFATLFGIPMVILGVAAHHRGVKQRIEAGEQVQPGIVSKMISKVTGK
jgi:hypothetical protein